MITTPAFLSLHLKIIREEGLPDRVLDVKMKDFGRIPAGKLNEYLNEIPLISLGFCTLEQVKGLDLNKLSGDQFNALFTSHISNKNAEKLKARRDCIPSAVLDSLQERWKEREPRCCIPNVIEKLEF